MEKKFNNVENMIKGLSTGEGFKNDSLKLIRGKRLSKFLFFLRCTSNLTQKELADKLECTQSRISKIESADDESLSIKDLMDYAKVLDLQLEIGYRKKSAKIVDLIKYHAFKIDGYLKKLTNLAKEKRDTPIADGVTKFCMEALVNISHLIVTHLVSLKKLEKGTIGKEKETIHISPPIDVMSLKKESLAKSK